MSYKVRENYWQGSVQGVTFYAMEAADSRSKKFGSIHDASVLSKA